MDMDVLSEILSALDLRGTLYFSTEFRPPWGVRVPRQPGVARFHLNLRGDCWVAVDDGDPVLLEAGDLVLVPHGAEHTLAGRPDAVCLSVDEVVELAGFTGRGALVYSGRLVPADADHRAQDSGADDPLGVDRGKSTRLICGHFSFDESAEHPFLSQLPSMLVIRHDDAASASRLELEEIFRIITREVLDGRPGSDAVVHRLSEVLFIQSVRVWAQQEHHDQGLVAALLDRHLGGSLEAFHLRPEHRWTVEELARAGGLSRTVFSERFRDIVGLSPMQYVTLWRLQKARGLLETRDLPLDAIAQRVGYESTAAFSRAFKKQVGSSPGAYRRCAAG